jgi:hypothetical protein
LRASTANFRVFAWIFQASFRTLVTALGRATLHRFFFGPRADCVHGPPAFPHPPRWIPNSDHSNDRRFPAYVGRCVGRYVWFSRPQNLIDVLLPLRGLTSQQRVPEDVRISEIRFAVVGYVVCETEAESYRNGLRHGSTFAPSSESRTRAT